MIQYILLGIAQGLTEFLPISSSGHLVVLQKLFGITNDMLFINVVLHLGTVFSLIIFFFKDILRLLRDFRLLSYVLLVSFITGVVGLIGEGFLGNLFGSVRMVSLSWLFTGIILILTKGFMQGNRDMSKLNLRDALILGITQAIAIIPGISRSGITISTLLFRKVDHQTAFRFSFLAAIPVIVGAFIWEAKKVNWLSFNKVNLFAGFIASLITGLLALLILKLILKKGTFHYFGYYCLVAGIISLIFIR